jgi:RNA polymerase sigma-70 factor, ECF subfamily
MFSDGDLDRYYHRLYRTALRLTGSEPDAADLTQQTLCRALERQAEFRGQSAPLTWLYRILTNGVRDWERRQAVRRAEALDEWAARPLGDGGRDVSDFLAEREQLDRLRQAIEGLSDVLRPAFIATVLDGYSHREAADILQVPVGTIASRVSAARKQVTDEMHKAFPETR